MCRRHSLPHLFLFSVWLTTIFKHFVPASDCLWHRWYLNYRTAGARMVVPLVFVYHKRTIYLFTQKLMTQKNHDLFKVQMRFMQNLSFFFVLLAFLSSSLWCWFSQHSVNFNVKVVRFYSHFHASPPYSGCFSYRILETLMDLHYGCIETQNWRCDTNATVVTGEKNNESKKMCCHEICTAVVRWVNR